MLTLRHTRACWIAAMAAVALLAVTLRGETITVATYNVENYVTANRLVDGVYRENYPKPERDKQALRAVIKALNADVLALQEMGPRSYLQELQRDLASEGVDYPHAELVEAQDPDRHVAILSRRPFSSVRAHTDLAFSYFGANETVKRGMLEVRFDAPGGEIAVFVLHLKSRYTDRADDPESGQRRASEATAARDRVLDVFPRPESARFLIVGDLNDVRSSRALRALTRRGETTLASVLTASDSRGHSWTHFYRKEETYSRVDYILVSPGLSSSVAGGVARVCDVPDTAQASDHRSVVVTLELN